MCLVARCDFFVMYDNFIQWDGFLLLPSQSFLSFADALPLPHPNLRHHHHHLHPNHHMHPHQHQHNHDKHQHILKETSMSCKHSLPHVNRFWHIWLAGDSCYKLWTALIIWAVDIIRKVQKACVKYDLIINTSGSHHSNQRTRSECCSGIQGNPVIRPKKF